MDANTFAPSFAPITSVEGAAARLAALEAAEQAANKARLTAYEAILAPYTAACDEAFALNAIPNEDGRLVVASDHPEVAAAWAARRAVSDNIDTHPDYAPLSAAHDAARAAVAACAQAYMVATTFAGDLLRIHRGGGWHTTSPDVVAILWALPEGPVKGLDGWHKVTVSPNGAWNGRREVRLSHHRAVVVSADNEGRSRITCEEDEAQRLADEKARNRAEHDAYQARLALVRGALDADPALRAAVEAVWASCHGATVHLYGPAVEAAGHSQGFPAVPVEEPGRSGALALAYLGWGWAPGQAGGVLILPGVGQVGVRGALRLPQEAVR